MELSQTLGILIQGRVTNWTKDVIHEYRENFPSAEIVLSTWENENLDKIECKVVQSKLKASKTDRE